jgi:hypothetical protein
VASKPAGNTCFNFAGLMDSFVLVAEWARLGLAVGRVRESSFGHGGDGFSGHEDAVDGLVSGHVVDYESEEWRQRIGFAAGAWMRQLTDGLDVFA